MPWNAILSSRTVRGRRSERRRCWRASPVEPSLASATRCAETLATSSLLYTTSMALTVSTEQNAKVKSPPKPRGPQRPPKAVATKPTAVAAVAPTEKLKAIVRRLPPNLPEEIFWQSVGEWVTDDTVTWRVFYPGKLRKRCDIIFIPIGAES